MEAGLSLPREEFVWWRVAAIIDNLQGELERARRQDNSVGVIMPTSIASSGLMILMVIRRRSVLQEVVRRMRSVPAPA